MECRVVMYEHPHVISTYLIVFVVGDFDYIESKDVNGVVHRVYTPVGKKEQGQFAIDVNPTFLSFFF